MPPQSEDTGCTIRPVKPIHCRWRSPSDRNHLPKKQLRKFASRLEGKLLRARSFSEVPDRGHKAHLFPALLAWPILSVYVANQAPSRQLYQLGHGLRDTCRAPREPRFGLSRGSSSRRLLTSNSTN